MSPLFERIAGLDGLAEELDRESDSVNEIISRVEEELSKRNLHLEAEVSLHSREVTYSDEESDETPACEEVLLTFQRCEHSKRWALHIVNRTYRLAQGEAEELLRESSTPVLESSRQLRIDALEQLEKLVDAVGRKAKANLEIIRRAKAAQL